MIDAILKYYLEIILGFSISIGTFLYRKATQHKRDHEALKLGMQAILGDKLFHLGERYIEQGYVTLRQQEMVDFLYDAYKAVNGNHGIDKVKKSIDDLPIK